MTLTITEATRTDPKDIIATATGYELVEALIETIMELSDTIPRTIYLIDQNRVDQEVIVDFTNNQEREAIEKIIEFWPEDDWDEARPVVEAVLAQSKEWLQTVHEVKVV